MRALALALVVVLSACAGHRQVTVMDVGLEAAFMGAVAIDTMQTAASLDRSMNQCGESNPVTGPCGDRVPLSVYVPAVLVLHGVVSYVLGGRGRTLWQGTTLGAEAGIVYGNYVLGYDL